MSDCNTIKINIISKSWESAEWESMRALPKVSNVYRIDLPETAISGVLKNFSKFTRKHCRP